MTAALVTVAILYLLAAGGFSGRLIHAEKKLQIEMLRAGDGAKTAERIWRITFDLKSGELIFYREERRQEEPVCPAPD